MRKKSISVWFMCFVMCNLIGYGQITVPMALSDIPLNNVPVGMRIESPKEFHYYDILPTAFSSVLFLPGSQYIIKAESVISEDVIESHILSWGRYEIFKDRIILYDSLFNYNMTIQQKAMPITFVSGFEYLIGNTLQEYPDQVLYNLNFAISQIPTDWKARYKKAALEKNKNILKVQYFYSSCVVLSLNPDQSYVLSLNRAYENTPNIDYSKGQWKRKGNLLTLMDSSLKHSFYAIILPDGKLQSMILPGLYEGQIMTSAESYLKLD